MYDNKSLNFDFPENITGHDIKLIFTEKLNLNINEWKIRLLFGGAEIKDDQMLYQHKIKDGFTIQVSKNKIIN